MKDAYNRSKEEHEEYHHLGHELLWRLARKAEDQEQPFHVGSMAQL
jgi:hypothetical protein